MKVDYDFNASLDAVAELLTDPQFLVDRCLALGGISATGQSNEENGRLVIETSREVEADLPSIVKKILGSVTTLDLLEVWQRDGDGWRGTWDVSIKGQPINVHADFELMPAGEGCSYSADAKVTAKVPLIGKKIEKSLEGTIANDLLADLEYTNNQLK